MKNLNLPPFYVGQKVVYVTGTNMPKDSIHTVTGIKQNSCGCWSIAINGEPFGKNNAYNMLYCLKCGTRNLPLCGNNLLRGWYAANFRPLQQQNFPLITLSKIREKEKEEYLVAN